MFTDDSVDSRVRANQLLKATRTQQKNKKGKNQIENSRFSVEEYRKLRNKPWVIKRLNKYADFNKILELYSEKDNQRKEKECKFLEDVRKETKGKKPVDINEEIEKIEKEGSWDF